MPRGRRFASGAGYRSGFEKRIRADLDKRGVDYAYEPMRIEYKKTCHYTPDFYLLSNGIFVEAKGRFTSADRSKHLLLKAQHPELDIRFVFQAPHNKLNARSKTTYASWCDRHGFKWAEGTIPDEWEKE